MVATKNVVSYAFEFSYEAYEYIYNYVKNNEIKEAILIQHSTMFSSSLVYSLMGRGVTGTVFLQDPGTVKDMLASWYFGRQIGILSNIIDHQEDLGKTNHLKFIMYKAPASISGVRIIDEKSGDCILLLSWYIYIRDDESGVSIRGHNRPALLIRKGQPGFDHFNEMFEKQLEYFNKEAEEDPSLSLTPGNWRGLKDSLVAGTWPTRARRASR